MFNVTRLVKAGFREKLVWSLALFVEDGPFSTAMVRGSPVRVFDSSKTVIGRPCPHTRADPFLFVFGDVLYLLYEIVFPRGHGKIAALRTSDLENFEDLGIILEEAHHLSFPFVFASENAIYLLPESSRGGGLGLYEFGDFPRHPTKIRDLLVGTYCDSFLWREQSTWYLFTTSSRGLELYFAEHLCSGAFSAHPQSPINTDPRYSRSAGGLVFVENRLCRLAQDCSTIYGRNVSVIAIDELTPTRYREQLLSEDIFDLRQNWNKVGAHHLSTISFLGKTVLAVDGKHREPFFNKLTRALSQLSPSAIRRN